MDEILSDGKILLIEYDGSDILKNKKIDEKGKLTYISIDKKHISSKMNFIALSNVPEFRNQKGIEILPHLLFEIIRDTIVTRRDIIIIEIDEIFEKFSDKSKIPEFLSALKSLVRMSKITIIMLTKSRDGLFKKYGLNKNLFDYC